jgi:SAM-dependent methyltransferase
MGEIFVRPMPAQPMPFTGERLTSDLTGETPVEHWHRYLLARELARGRDVLDIACGEGYGSALMAQVATSVVGMDVAEDAVVHATAAYPAANLRFERGDARRIPLPDASVDLVVSFETLEHFVEHDEFLLEARRVLRPGGALLVSTPERDTYSPEALPANPYHAKELTEAEFDALLRAHFVHVTSQGQRVLLGSVLAGAGGALYCFERRGAGHFESSRGLARIRYIVALASAAPTWQLPPSVFIDTGRIGYTDGAALERLNDELLQLRAAHTETQQAQADAVTLRQERDALREAADQMRGELAAARAEVTCLLTQLSVHSETIDKLQAAEAGSQEALREQTRRADAMEAASRRAETAALIAREQADRAETTALVAREQADHMVGLARDAKERVEVELRLVRSSTSWRVTAPLRALRMLAARPLTRGTERTNG